MQQRGGGRYFREDAEIRRESLEAAAAAAQSRVTAAELRAAEEAAAAKVAQAAATVAAVAAEAARGDAAAAAAQTQLDEVRRGAEAELFRAAAEEKAAAAYSGVRDDLRALRRRYFKRGGERGAPPVSGGERCVGGDDEVDGASSEDEDGGSGGMGRVDRRLDLQGLVSAMLSFKRASDEDPAAATVDGMLSSSLLPSSIPSGAAAGTAAAAAQRELRLMEECLLLMLAGDLGTAPAPSGGGVGSSSVAGSYGLVSQVRRISTTDAQSLGASIKSNPPMRLSVSGSFGGTAKEPDCLVAADDEKEQKREEPPAPPGDVERLLSSSSPRAVAAATGSAAAEAAIKSPRTADEEEERVAGTGDYNDDDDDNYVGHRGYGVAADLVHAGVTGLTRTGTLPDSYQLSTPPLPPPPPPPPGRTRVPQRQPPLQASTLHLHPIDEKNSTHAGGTRGIDALSPSAIGRAMAALGEGEDDSGVKGYPPGKRSQVGGIEEEARAGAPPPPHHGASMEGAGVGRKVIVGAIEGNVGGGPAGSAEPPSTSMGRRDGDGVDDARVGYHMGEQFEAGVEVNAEARAEAPPLRGGFQITDPASLAGTISGTAAGMGLEVCQSPREVGVKHVRGAHPRRKPPPQPQPQYATGKQLQPQPQPQPQYPERGADHLRSTLGRVSANEHRGNSGGGGSGGGEGAFRKASASTRKLPSSSPSSYTTSGSSAAVAVAKRATLSSASGASGTIGGYQKISNVYGRRPPAERGTPGGGGSGGLKHGSSSASTGDRRALPGPYGHTEAKAEITAYGGRRDGDEMSFLTASDNDVLQMLTEVARGGRR
jgi:hypothetical protein